jgi:hypothetical protein
MKQLLTELKTYLLDYTNNINLPSYEQARKTPLVNQSTIIDFLDNYNLQSGFLNLDDHILHLNNIYFIELTSLNPFHVFVNDTFIYTSFTFSYKNLTAPLTKLSMLNYQMNHSDLVTVPPGLTSMTINYVLLNE